VAQASVLCGLRVAVGVWRLSGVPWVAVNGGGVLLNSIRGRRCARMATGRGAVARPRLVCPLERSDPLVLAVSV